MKAPAPSRLLFAVLAASLLISGCIAEQPLPSRESKIPADAVKMTPATDAHPPVMLSGEWSAPVPVPVGINTAGAEDSPFVTPDGNTLYFFFTPDVRVPVEKQVVDGVTGIYVSHKNADGSWGEAERVLLEERGKAAGDGCEFVLGNKMWFCSVREGYTGINWFTAELVNGKWADWKKDDEFPASYEVGELHFSAYGNEVYFHSSRAGGKGGLDIWVSRKVDGKWQEPENVAAVNTERDEGWPFLSSDGNELWFNRDYGVWRSKKEAGGWSEPELIVSPLAGEPTLDDAGNLYFVHHYYENDTMIEADIYVAHRN